MSKNVLINDRCRCHNKRAVFLFYSFRWDREKKEKKNKLIWKNDNGAKCSVERFDSTEQTSK